MKFYKFKVDKLTRDKTPEVLRIGGAKVFERTMNDEEYLLRLKNKFLEEAEEVILAKTKNEIKEELADLLELIIVFAKINEMTLSEIISEGEKKREEKGTFLKKIYVSHLEVSEDNEHFEYYKKNSNKYPEII